MSTYKKITADGLVDQTEEDIVLTKKLEKEYNDRISDPKNNYSLDRKTAYPDYATQLDMIYWDKKNGTKKWEEAIDKVKADNPKPE